MDWRSKIEKALRARSTDGCAVFPVWHPLATQDAILAAQTVLNLELPEDLREVLALSDGVNERMEWAHRAVDIGAFLWPIARIVARNREMRSDSALRQRLTLAQMLFFADNGFGDSFGYLLSVTDQADGIQRIVMHDHETDELPRSLIHLRSFLPVERHPSTCDRAPNPALQRTNPDC